MQFILKLLVMNYVVGVSEEVKALTYNFGQNYCSSHSSVTDNYNLEKIKISDL